MLKTRKWLIVMVILLFLLLGFDGMYHAVLRPAELEHFQVVYSTPYIWWARPFTYWAASFVISSLVLIWAKKAIPKSAARIFLIGSLAFLAVYVVAVLCVEFGSLRNIRILSLMLSPVIYQFGFSLSGICFAVGGYRNA